MINNDILMKCLHQEGDFLMRLYINKMHKSIKGRLNMHYREYKGPLRALFYEKHIRLY